MKRVLESTYSPTERRVLFSIRPSTGRNLSRYLEWLENGRHRMERHRELSGAKFMDSANYLDRSATIPLFAPPSLSLSLSLPVPHPPSFRSKLGDAYLERIAATLPVFRGLISFSSTDNPRVGDLSRPDWN